MIEHILATGTSGELRILDYSLYENDRVEFWIRSTTPIAIEELPWGFSVDDQFFGWRQKDFLATTEWQNLTNLYTISPNDQFVELRLGNTGTTELNGPTKLQNVELQSFVGADDQTVWIKVDGVYVKAAPYVNDEGVWKIAKPFIRTPTGWKETG